MGDQTVRFKEIPVLVQRTTELATQHGFEHSCLDEVGQFLRILSGLKSNARLAEIGTGFAVGCAWIASGMDSESTLYSIELDAGRVDLVREIFAGCGNVQFLCGDWKQILTHAPFDLVFVDAKPAKYEEADVLIKAMGPNGVIVLDDFTPVEHWPEEWREKPDVVRDKWLNDERLLCMEIRTSERNSVLIARRVK